MVGLKRLENVWLGDFMYFRPSNNEIPFKNIKEFTLGQTKGKYFRIPEKLCMQLKDMTQLLSLSILRKNMAKFRRANRRKKIAPDIGEQPPDKNICN